METDMTDTPSLYQRLGSADGVTAIASEIVDRHLKNPLIKQRFQESDPEALKVLVRDFITMGTGGPNNYQGRDMLTAHTGLNLNEREFVTTIDDVLAALDAKGIDPVSRMEVLAILYSFKDEILFR
jgi:hemoglobin